MAPPDVSELGNPGQEGALRSLARVEAGDPPGAVLAHRARRADVALAHQPEPRERHVGLLRQALDDEVEQRIQCALARQIEEQAADGFEGQLEIRRHSGKGP